MNLQYYRKIKGKEPVIINLDSDGEGEGDNKAIDNKNDFHIKKQADRPSQEIQRPNQFRQNTAMNASKEEGDLIEQIVQYEHSENSYQYSYSCHTFQQENLTKQPKQLKEYKLNQLLSKSNNSPDNQKKQINESAEKHRQKILLLRLKIAEKLAAKRKN